MWWNDRNIDPNVQEDLLTHWQPRREIYPRKSSGPTSESWRCPFEYDHAMWFQDDSIPTVVQEARMKTWSKDFSKYDYESDTSTIQSTLIYSSFDDDDSVPSEMTFDTVWSSLQIDEYSNATPASYSSAAQYSVQDNGLFASSDDDSSVSDNKLTAIPDSVSSCSELSDATSYTFSPDPDGSYMVVEGKTGFVLGRETCKPRQRNFVPVICGSNLIDDQLSVKSDHFACHDPNAIKSVNVEPNDVCLSPQWFVSIPPVHHDGPGEDAHNFWLVDSGTNAHMTEYEKDILPGILTRGQQPKVTRYSLWYCPHLLSQL